MARLEALADVVANSQCSPGVNDDVTPEADFMFSSPS